MRPEKKTIEWIEQKVLKDGIESLTQYERLKWNKLKRDLPANILQLPDQTKKTTETRGEWLRRMESELRVSLERAVKSERGIALATIAKMIFQQAQAAPPVEAQTLTIKFDNGNRSEEATA